MHQFDSDQLEAAAQRLEADAADAFATQASRPGLVAKIVSDLKRLAGAARATHPLGWAEIDGRLRNALSEIIGTAGAAQLLAAEHHHAALLALTAEGEAAEAEGARRRWQAAYERQQEPMREAMRATWAAKAADPVLSALTRFDLRADEARRALGVVSIGDEDAVIAAVEALVEASKDIANGAGIARRESRIRRAAAAADAAVAATLAA